MLMLPHNRWGFPACILETCSCFYKDKRLSEQKFSVTHNNVTIDFNGAAGWDHVHMNGGMPIGTGKFWIRIAKGHMQARHLLILQQIPDQPFQTGERPNSKLACTIAVGDGEEIVAYLLRQGRILAADPGNVAVLYR